ncbi:hypothetical protein [Brachybacterium sp. GPGPB12]|uniref:hypothetical protein n=1 Tax=Brachybacterium sp. GPGPB12 TaxID=3023517 RepID=UPI0031346007
MSTSDSRTGTGKTDAAESTSKLPAFDSASSPSEQGLGSGKGSAARGASRARRSRHRPEGRRRSAAARAGCA